MSQVLQKMTRKDGKAQGVANRLHDGYRNNLTIADIFRNVIFGEPINNKITNEKPINNFNDSSTTAVPNYIMSGPVSNLSNILISPLYNYIPNGKSKSKLSDYLT